MAKVRKGNRELTVAEHKVNDFVAQGYDLISEEGAVLKKGAPVTLQDYKERYVEAQKKIKEKDEKITQLEEERDSLKSALEDLKKQDKKVTTKKETSK